MKSASDRVCPAFFSKLIGSLLYVFSIVAVLGLTAAILELPLIPSAGLDGNNPVVMSAAIDSTKISECVGLMFFSFWCA